MSTMSLGISLTRRVGSTIDSILGTFAENILKRRRRRIPDGAVRVLRYMVHDPARLDTASDIYLDLLGKYPKGLPSPPNEIKQQVNQKLFEVRIGEAKKLVESGQYEQAITLLENVRAGFPTLFDGEAKVQNDLLSAYKHAATRA